MNQDWITHFFEEARNSLWAERCRNQGRWPLPLQSSKLTSRTSNLNALVRRTHVIPTRLYTPLSCTHTNLNAFIFRAGYQSWIGRFLVGGTNLRQLLVGNGINVYRSLTRWTNCNGKQRCGTCIVDVSTVPVLSFYVSHLFSICLLECHFEELQIALSSFWHTTLKFFEW
jgi:hypothetical protein